ncbi:hypothetical protein BH20ACI2_BH20ACI2_24660 [soil metagenome]
MTEKSDPLENAIAERVNGILKDELLEKRFESFREAREKIDEALPQGITTEKCQLFSGRHNRLPTHTKKRGTGQKPVTIILQSCYGDFSVREWDKNRGCEMKSGESKVEN